MSAIKQDFIKHLQDLQDTRKDVIESLTRTCAQNKKYAQLLSETLFEKFREAHIERKVALLFLMDSILKNCKDHYLTYIERGIVDAFCDAYIASGNKSDVRKKLRILFKTWEIHFSGLTINSILSRIEAKTQEALNSSFTVEELDQLISYYRSNGIDASHLELQRKKAAEQKPAPKPVKKIEKTQNPLSKEKTSMSGGPSDAQQPRPIKKTEPKIEPLSPTQDEVPRQKKIPKMIPEKTMPSQFSRFPNQTPPKSAEAEGGYRIKKKDGKGEKERRSSFEKEEQYYAPITKFVKTEKGPIRQEDHQYQGGYSNMQGGSGYGHRAGSGSHGGVKKEIGDNSSRSMMPSHHQSTYGGGGGYYPSQAIEEEAQFSDDETSYQPQGQGIGGSMQQSQFGSQYPHQFQQKVQGQGQSQMMGQSQLRPQMQQRDQHQHMRQQQQQQHQPYHGGSQQSMMYSSPQVFSSQTQGQGQLQQQPQRMPIQQQPVSIQPQNLQQPQQPMHHIPRNTTDFQPTFSGQQVPIQAPTQAQYIHSQFSPENIPQQQAPYVNPQSSGQAQPKRGLAINEIKKIFFGDQRNAAPATKGHESSSINPNENREAIPDFEYPCNTSPTKRIDSFPGPMNWRKPSEINDQSGELTFKSLLINMQKRLPNFIKKKYQYKQESLSSMIVKNDLKAVDSLYRNLPYRCSSCAMRFTHKTVLQKHLDWHYQFNTEQQERRERMNIRTQMFTNDQWIKDEGNNALKTADEENLEEKFEFENYVLGTEPIKSCKACGESFKEVWDKKREAWLFDEAAKVKYDEDESAEDGTKQKGNNFDLMHFRCFKLCLQNESK